MSAMPAEAEPRRPGQGAVPPETRPKAAEPPVVDVLPAQPSTGQPRPTQGRTANTGRVSLRTAAPRTAAPRIPAPRTAAPKAVVPRTPAALRTAVPRTTAARTAAGRATEPGSAGARAPRSRSAEALEIEVRGTVRAAESLAAQDRVAEPPWAEAAEVQTSEAGAGEAEILEGEILEAGATQTETPEARAAETARRRALWALSPATVRPRQAGLMPSPARRPHPVGLRPRRISTRLHPTGVRACSDVLCGQPPIAALPVPQARPSHASDAPQRLRLTRRGRVVLAVFAAVVVSLIGLAVASGTPAAGSATPAGAAGHSMTRIVVQPGQTLWMIAMRADPQADPRQVVQQIIAANALRDGSIQAGQRLLVPRG